MDKNDEMMAQFFMEGEANATAKRHQQLVMLGNLLSLCQHLLAVRTPQRGGSRVGKVPNKDRHR
jgi:hypothetical protein